jgi:4-hydroxy-tetrahydrodipicolinate synthase
MSSNLLRGCGTALVTPFLPNGSLDEPALRALVQWQLEAGVHMLVPCGSTGEAVTLSAAEHRRVVEITVEETNGRVPVIAGAGSNDTQKAIATSREMQAIGATHLLHVTPMYNRPPQRALLAHFRAIADACALPIMLYNVPGRTAVNLEAATTLELAADARFVAVKEASGNLSQIATIVRERPDGFRVLSGDDGFTLAVVAPACRRCTSTWAPTWMRARWWTRTRWWAAARRSASACTSRQPRRSAACSSPSARRPW